MSLFTLLFLVAIAFVIRYLLKNANTRILPKYKINVGEEIVNNVIHNIFDQDYVLLTNVTVPVGKDQTTQIDHLLITLKGIFVIETKHYAGVIDGQEDAPTWTQKTRRLREFSNPIKQNAGHVRALQTLLPEIERSAFIN